MTLHVLARQPTTTSLAPSYTTVETTPRFASPLRLRRGRANSSTSSSSEGEAQGMIELQPVTATSPFSPSPTTNNSNTSLAPPPYTSSPSFTQTGTGKTFTAQVQLQIQTAGKPCLSLPLPPRPDPIPVFGPATADQDGTSGSIDCNHPVYTSLRHGRGSGTCCLVDGAGDAADAKAAVSATTYRFGPGRPPRVTLWLPGRGPSVAVLAGRVREGQSGDEDNVGEVDDYSDTWDSFEIKSVGLFTRSQRFQTRLGTFEWRYAGRRERKGCGLEAVNSLLVLERVVRVFHSRTAPSSSSSSSGGRGQEEVRVTVARFARSPALRSPGSDASSAGNGGRLFVDLAGLLGDAGADHEDGEAEGIASGGKADREMALAMVVTTCICMLKKEIDRRRAQQAAIIAGAAGGGGP